MSIARVAVTLDDNVPEYMSGIVRCLTVISEDEDGNEIKDYPELIDNTEYTNREDLIEDVARRINVSTDIIDIEG
ncbi:MULTISPECIES: hypothetical protein [unclassified Cobetia]|uniref:hypothetical protein n=1 Tax=unclassified Cobetia TaxID=2609414 RepID=UPI002098642D|nr:MULTISPECIES: hypothetical protein [unclassified Cobetia]MCO7231363.1 hypothetical protein [Cobetia sp. Dlab-2-AX]MCO7234228.1 hypothetical protein [Cobetia sp. Dlab-2-U]